MIVTDVNLLTVLNGRNRMKLKYVKLWVTPERLKGKQIEMVTLHAIIETGKQSALREVNNLFKVQR